MNTNIFIYKNLEWHALLSLCLPCTHHHQPFLCFFFFFEANCDWLIKIITEITETNQLRMFVSCRYVLWKCVFLPLKYCALKLTSTQVEAISYLNVQISKKQKWKVAKIKINCNLLNGIFSHIQNVVQKWDLLYFWSTNQLSAAPKCLFFSFSLSLFFLLQHTCIFFLPLVQSYHTTFLLTALSSFSNTFGGPGRSGTPRCLLNWKPLLAASTSKHKGKQTWSTNISMQFNF